MKRLLVKFLCFISCLVAIDISFGAICKFCIKNSKGGDTYKIEYSARYSTEDILVFGSSRAQHHYVPQILEDSLGLSVYNCGLDGHGVIYSFGLLSMILKRHIPKLVIYDIVERVDIDVDESLDNRNLRTLYRFNDVQQVNEIITDFSPRNKYLLLCNLYKYNEYFLTIFSDYFNFSNAHQGDDGYIPIFESRHIRFDTVPAPEKTESKWDSNKKEYLKRFISLCIENNIKVVLIYSPNYYGYSPNIEQLRAYCEEIACEFISFIDSSQFVANDSYFFDPYHLNNCGAEQYSKLVGHRLGRTLP